MTEQEEDFRLSANEEAVWQTFRCRCVVENITQFSCNTLRDFKLDTALYGSQQGKLGGFFMKLVVLGYIRQVGHVASTFESRHGGEIKLYEFTEASEK